MSKRVSIMLGVAALAVSLTACTQNKEKAGPTLANGNWASSDGVYVAEFLNGSFRAVANDTGNVISEGSYIAKSKENIELRWQSKLTGLSNSAQCVKPDINVMNCTDAHGSRFSLRRT